MADNNLMDNMWEILKIIVDALKKNNPKLFVENQNPLYFL